MATTEHLVPRIKGGPELDRERAPPAGGATASAATGHRASGSTSASAAAGTPTRGDRAAAIALRGDRRAWRSAPGTAVHRLATYAGSPADVMKGFVATRRRRPHAVRARLLASSHMVCHECGKPVEPGQHFCASCGASLRGVTDVTQRIPSAKAPPPLPATEPTEEWAAQARRGRRPDPCRRRPRRERRFPVESRLRARISRDRRRRRRLGVDRRRPTAQPPDVVIDPGRTTEMPLLYPTGMATPVKPFRFGAVMLCGIPATSSPSPARSRPRWRSPATRSWYRPIPLPPTSGQDVDA